MLGAAGRMQTLINDLLALARIATAAQPFVPVDLATVVGGVLGDLETQIARCGGHVTVGPLPTVDADPLQLRQLLQNLIGNALKFQRPDCPPEVTISAEIIDAPATASTGSAPWYRLAVRDTGIGFDQQYAEHIFRVFERLHGRTEYEGTGIGLALCRQIVERHGGDIRAEGMPGQGATFLVTLPAHHVKEARA
jgi:signal transduction histidine kinase